MDMVERKHGVCSTFESLGSSSNRMWLHVSEPPENTSIEYFLRFKMWLKVWV